MKSAICGLVLITLASPLMADPDVPCEQDPTTADRAQASKWEELARQTKAEPCPAKVQVLSYIWLDPATGREYPALRLHCPGKDEV